MKKTIVLFTLITISAFNNTQAIIQKIDFKEKFGFLHEEENQTFTKAIQQIKWRIRSGYLAELNNNLNAMRWLVKKLAQNFGIKTTTIAAKFGTFAANQYIKKANQYIKLLASHGEKAKSYQRTLYPEYDADLLRSDRE